MKKMIYTAMALVVVAIGCTKSNIVDVPEVQKTPITFDTYNGKIPVSKASEITQSNITKIYVTGFQAEDEAAGYTSFYMNPESGLIKSGDNWTYSPLSYWPANGTLEFVAYGDNTPRIKDGTPGSLVPVNDSYAVFDYTVPTAAASQKDLIAAHVAPTESTAPVVFEMKHLLSRIGFKLETVGSGTAVIIKNVILHGTYNTTARVDLTNEGDEDDPFLTALSNSPTTTSYSLFTSGQYFQTSTAGAVDIYDMSSIPTVDPDLTGEQKEAAEAEASAATTAAMNNRYMMILPGEVEDFVDSNDIDEDTNTTEVLKPCIEVVYSLGGADAKAILTLPDVNENTNWTFAAGSAYQFIFKISISKIEFTGTVHNWDESGTTPGTPIN